MFGSTSADHLRGPQIQNLRTPQMVRRSYGDYRFPGDLRAPEIIRRSTEYITEIIDLRTISGSSPGPGDHSLPPVFVSLLRGESDAGTGGSVNLIVAVQQPVKPMRALSTWQKNAPKRHAAVARGRDSQGRHRRGREERREELE
ncbi:hypothetical protein B0H11DRAFT_2220171 [Mycena galericulata]|nr:hypothetical protein B0H11DRAFT_2220171 [Mycena galericulata]